MGDQSDTATRQQHRRQRPAHCRHRTLLLPPATCAGQQRRLGIGTHRNVDPLVPQHPPKLVLEAHHTSPPSASDPSSRRNVVRALLCWLFTVPQLTSSSPAISISESPS